MPERDALVYNPGLHVLGGGERYTFGLAQALSPHWRVRVAGVGVPPAEELARRGFPTDLDVFALPYQQFPEESARYDLAIAVAINPPSYPSRAARSTMAVQFPFRKPIGVRHPRAAFRERRALGSYDHFVVNSEFTRRWVAERWRRESDVLHPPVVLGRYDESAKQPLILSIARFIPEKGHAALLDGYAALPPALARSWQLVIVGGTTDTDAERRHLDALRGRARGMNVDLRPNASQREVLDLLDAARLFWHGAGYGRSSDHPEDAEHFGISIVEAMSRGAVPLVHADGGPLEFVDAQNGATWTTPAELAEVSSELMANRDVRIARARASTRDAQRFSVDVFRREVRRLFP